MFGLKIFVPNFSAGAPRAPMQLLPFWTTLFYYDCLGHQELENIAVVGSAGFIEFVWRDGTDLTP